MARANRHCLPRYVWHITHRCHKKEFLLKFARDQRRWLQWLFEAMRKWGNMVVTASLVNRYAATSDLLDEWRRYA